MSTSTVQSAHVVRAAEIRAQIVQREYARQWQPGDWLPYIDDAVTSLPQRVRDLVAAGHPKSAEYWLVSLEKFTKVIDEKWFQQRVTELDEFELVGADQL